MKWQQAGHVAVSGVCLWVAGSVLAASEVARPADAFVDSIGVNVHAVRGRANSPYESWDQVVGVVGDLGIRYVRDEVEPDGVGTARLNQLTAQTGAKVALIMQYGYTGHPQGLTQMPYVIEQAKALTGLAMMEGPNEYNEVNPPGWQDILRTYQIALSTQVKSDPLLASKPMLAPSVGVGFTDLSDLGAYVDAANMHSYAINWVQPPTEKLATDIAHAQQLAGLKPVYATETGYSNATASAAGISEKASGKYIPRLLLEYFNAGVVKTFPYELMDSYPDDTLGIRDGHFGLVRTDFTYKPVAVAIKNSISLLEDPGAAFDPGTLDYTLTGGGANLHHTLLQKRDGSFWLALWQEAAVYDPNTKTDLTVGAVDVSLDLASPILSAMAYLPGGSMTATDTWGSVSHLDLHVPDQVMLVRLTPTPEPGSALVLCGAVFMLAQRRSRRDDPGRR